MKLRTLATIILVLFVAVIAVGCPLCPAQEPAPGDPDPDPDPTPGEQEFTEESVTIGYGAWVCATASSYLVKNILEQRMDVEVDMAMMDMGILWQSLAAESIDFMVAAWLPTTHEEYYAQVEDQVVLIRENFEGARIGLVVPDYVDIDSITELNDYVDEFGGQIVGIDSGAGIMTNTREAIDVYGLVLSLLESSDAAMSAELGTAIGNEEWIVVTGWTPHWKFAQWDLKFLEDPENVYGDEESIYTASRLDFAEDNPRTQQFLERYSLTDELLGELMFLMEDMDEDAAAQQWMEDNSDIVDQWVEGLEPPQ